MSRAKSDAVATVVAPHKYEGRRPYPCKKCGKPAQYFWHDMPKTPKSKARLRISICLHGELKGTCKACNMLDAPRPTSKTFGQLKESLAVIDRQKTHGKFTDHARVSQAFKAGMRQEDGWARLDPDMREALDMVQHKIARILTGDPTVQDHWDDVMGYASRVAERLAAEREARLK